MRTQLSQFCEQFVSTLKPVLAPVDRALAALGADAEDSAGQGLRAELEELRDQFRLVCQKVEGQRAYVLIFGPLKSGKSTLMNSLAGAYVSEVSSLPAYPSLVFVSHGKKQEFVTTDYEGRTSAFENTESLTERIDAAHLDLAAAIRETEEHHESFDPEEHFPEAIRRIDVKLPAKNLAESGAVLVDTPGLYTRMRFGYDRMTRDFRNAAACAIFVVKSDTLFLEQVFSEFHQLLDLFSRIFLVVNMDTTKQDVGPGGKLVPSMEQKAPDRIVAAFESLAMPQPLKDATESGRLRIYPVDLMKAASRTLQGDTVQGTDFGKFQTELDDYLASTEYLVAFLNDSFQRANHLITSTTELCEGSFTQTLRDDLREAESQKEAIEEELSMLADCQKLDWSPAFAGFSEELLDALQRTSRDVGARIARDMSAAIETWILSSHSLQWLLDTVWRPLFQEYVQMVRDTAERCFEKSIYHENGGLEFDEDLRHFLNAIDVDFRPLRQAAYDDMASQKIKLPAIPLDTADIPIRRGLFDVVTFRSEDKVRIKLFGKDSNNKISARQKSQRLGEPAKKFLNQFLLNFREEFFPETIQATQDRYGDNLAKATVAKLHEILQSREPGLRDSAKSLGVTSERIRKILAPVEALETEAESIGSAVRSLMEQFSATDANAILEPVAPKPRTSTTRQSSGSRRSRRQRRS